MYIYKYIHVHIYVYIYISEIVVRLPFMSDQISDSGNRQGAHSHPSSLSESEQTIHKSFRSCFKNSPNIVEKKTSNMC